MHSTRQLIATGLAALLAACAGAAVPADAPPGMVWIPGGTFSMGADDEFALPAEGPVHRVRVDGFYLAERVVTNAEFKRFVDATGYRTLAERAPDAESLLAQLPAGAPPPDPALLLPGSLVFAPTGHPVALDDVSRWWRWTPGADWRHPGGPGTSIEQRGDHPVVQIAWADAEAYAAWAGGRLPTEAEWEYAARGGIAGGRYAWGNAPLDAARPQAHIYPARFPEAPAGTAPAGAHRPNGYGLFDMGGNVWQWTADWYHDDGYAADHARGTVRNPAGPAVARDIRQGPPARVLRGGSHLCHDSYCRGYRVSARSPGTLDTGTSHIGFRIVMTTEQWARRRGSGSESP